MKWVEWIALLARRGLNHSLMISTSWWASREICVWYSWRWREEGGINWYPWGVQIYGYELAVARVGPGVGRMLSKTQLRGNGMKTRINAKYFEEKWWMKEQKSLILLKDLNVRRWIQDRELESVLKQNDRPPPK